MTGVKLVAPLRCGVHMCSVLTDLHAEMCTTHSLSSHKASSLLSKTLIGLSPPHSIDVNTFDPTVAPPFAGHGGNLSIMVGLAMRWADAWEWLACSCIHAAEVRAAAKGGSHGHSVSEEGRIFKAAAVGPHAAAVSTFMRRRLASLLVTATTPCGFNDRCTAPLFAISTLDANDTARLFANATLDAAVSVGVRTLHAVDVDAPSAAFAAFAAAMNIDVRADLAGSRVDLEEWVAAQARLAVSSYASRELAWSASQLILGLLAESQFRSDNSKQSILRRVQSIPENMATADGQNIRVACLDPHSSTFSRDGELHQQSQCLYGGSQIGGALLSMSSAEWLFFLLCCASAAWLVMTVAVSLVATLCVLPKIRERNATPVGSWPHIAVLVPCYMPNEEGIIEETLDAICDVNCSYAGVMDVYVPYNTPHALDAIEGRLAKLTELNGRVLRCERVVSSTSKAQNLEHALRHMVGDASIVIIFDADHHPRANTIETLVRTLVHHPQLTMAQGSVLVERGGYPLLQWLVDGMEWASWHFHAPGLSLLAGSAYFGGGNAAWRTEALQELGFDPNMLTEDIDISIRALSLGHRMQFVPWAQVGELCPPTLAAFYRQRLRWAMGWEQVTFKRLTTLFSSNAITEAKKWRTSILLLARYSAMINGLIAMSNILMNLGHELGWVGFGGQIAPPIRVASTINLYASLCALTFIILSLGLFREPWWRWVHVVMFFPFGTWYLLATTVLVFISWIRLSCLQELTWVPTARQAGAETHSIKMGASKGEESTFATSAKSMPNETTGLLAPKG